MALQHFHSHMRNHHGNFCFRVELEAVYSMILVDFRGNNTQRTSKKQFSDFWIEQTKGNSLILLAQSLFPRLRWLSESEPERQRERRGASKTMSQIKRNRRFSVGWALRRVFVPCKLLPPKTSELGRNESETSFKSCKHNKTRS